MIEVRPLPVSDPLAEPPLARDLASRYLIWDAFVAGARRVDLHPLILPREAHEQAVRVSEAVVRVVGGVAGAALVDREERATYRLHPDVDRLALASHRGGDVASLVRVDLLLGEGGVMRACEVNADCPGGHNEALGLPKLARAAGLGYAHNPTVVVRTLCERLALLARGKTVALVYATAYAEDLQVCALLKRELEAMGQRAVLAPPTAPRERDGRVFVGRDEIGALYRYFPAEYMEGQNNLPGLARAIESGALRTLSSFSQIYLQSKASFVRTWAHAPTLSREDRAVVDAHVPESRLAAEIGHERLLAERRGWVVKRAFGRVGDEVLVGETMTEREWAAALAAVWADHAHTWIAQRFVPQTMVSTPWGARYVTLGAYVQDGAFVGYFARLTTESHASHDALVVPVFIEREVRP